MSVLRIPTAAVFEPLLAPRRFKGAKGGRGSGKSHFFAGLLVEDMVAGHVRAACVRETQSSIKDSVKQLIEDKVAEHGLSRLFSSTEFEIRGPNDSLVVFNGLQNHTAARIKSLEGFNRCWVEEAQTISQRSLDTLTPTFRREDAELWFGWNPLSPDDPVEKLFKDGEGDPDFACVSANWNDNPWFPSGLRADMERDRARDPDKYAHVWGGAYRLHSEARVFRNWKVEAFETPADAEFRFGADWGFAVDPTVLVRCFLKGRTLYVDQCVSEVGCEIDRTPALFERIPGSRQWTITADSSRPETVSYMRRQKFRIVPAIKGPGSVEDGVEFLKSFDIVVHPRCQPVIDELSKYALKVDPKTNEVLPVLDDKDNHTIDALRYALEALRRTMRKPGAQPPSANPPDLGRWRRSGATAPNDWKTA